MIVCKKCKYEHYNEADVDLHHIVPKVVGGKDIDGRVYLCRENKGNDCHRKLHSRLRENTEIKRVIINATNEWLDE